MKRFFLLGAFATAAATLVVFGSAWAGAPSRSSAPAEAAVFMSKVVHLVAANRYDDAWAQLHPVQQRLISQARYTECESRTPVPGRIQSLQVLWIRDKTLIVPGGHIAAEAMAIRIHVVIAGAAGQRVPVEHTFHAVPLDGRWVWFLPAERLASYRAGDCPGYSPTPTYTSGGLQA